MRINKYSISDIGKVMKGRAYGQKALSNKYMSSSLFPSNTDAPYKRAQARDAFICKNVFVMPTLDCITFAQTQNIFKPSTHGSQTILLVKESVGR